MAKFQVDEAQCRIIAEPEGYIETNALLSLPSRRWLPKYRKVTIPATRMNMRMLMDLIEAGTVDLDGTDGKGWAYIKKMGTSTLGDRQFPADYPHKLKPFGHQGKALAKTYRNDEAAWYMRMGTGKSKVIVDYNVALFLERKILGTIVILPLSVAGVWQGEDEEEPGELMKHCPIPYKHVLVDSSFDYERWRTTQWKGSHEMWWFFVGIESLSQGRTFDQLMPLVKHMAVSVGVDESSRIGNYKTIRTGRVWELGREAKARFISTGTPVTRNMVNLFSQFQFLNPAIIGAGDFWAFRNRYAVMGGYKQKNIVSYKNVEELMGLIEPYTYTCDKPEGMPKQLWTQRVVQLADVQKEYYRKIKRGEMEGVTVANVLSKTLRLEQVVGGFYSDDPKVSQDPLTGRVKKTAGIEHRIIEGKNHPKIIDLHHVAEEADRPMIVWARFKHEVRDIAEAMGQHGRVALFTGDTSTPDRMQIKADFQKGKYDFLVGNQAVGGIGYTFTRAHVMVYYSNTRSLEDRLQSEDRIHRTGQDDECLYIDMIADKTVDRVKMASLAAKKDLDIYVRDQLRESGFKWEDLLGELE